MAKLNRKCIICGTRYSYCPHCSEDANKPTWMAIFCGENCKDIYTTLDDFRDGRISREDAQIVLNGLDLSPIEKLPKNFQEIFNEIIVKKDIEAMAETVEDTADAVDITKFDKNNEEVIQNEVKEIKKPRTRKAKNNE
uniref:hypothetical protein n=1 Tax=Coprococcus catus TaxID=116085 RepID=UPI0022E3E814|nr:hypothetical protein [Coprococcus catus]